MPNNAVGTEKYTVL